MKSSLRQSNNPVYNEKIQFDKESTSIAKFETVISFQLLTADGSSLGCFTVLVPFSITYYLIIYYLFTYKLLIYHHHCFCKNIITLVIIYSYLFDY
jgi:hypothetical protein